MALANSQGGFVTLLKKRNFLLLWLAQLTSMTMLNASNYALIVLIQIITGSTTLIGLAIVCFSLPAVLFGAPAGVFVDHHNKRRVLWYSNCLRAIATFGFENERADFYEQAVEDGKILVVVEAKGENSAARLEQAERIMTDAGAFRIGAAGG